MSKYFSFTNEATRSEFWAVHLVCWIGTWIVMVSGLMVAGALTYVNDVLGGLTAALVILATIVTSITAILSVSARRCREINISPWWCVPILFPFVGLIVTIVLGILAPDPNRIRFKPNV